MFKKVKELVRGKNVLIVGNSIELTTLPNAKTIDSYDIVVRLGNGITGSKKEELAIGSKVDIWVTGLMRTTLLKDPIYYAKLKPVLKLLNGSRLDITGDISSRVSEKWDIPLIYSDKEILEVYSKYGIISDNRDCPRISTGMWTLKFFIEKVQTQGSLTIIGFDFFKCKLFDIPKGGKQRSTSWFDPTVTTDKTLHNGVLEEKLVSEYIQQGVLKHIILSSNTNKVFKQTKYGRY
jgi:hypothetical protein